MKPSAIIILLLTLLCSIQAYSKAEHKIWVLVIGISDYQYINDLRYADDDALAFYQYAKRSLGHRAKPDQMRLLINEEATFSSIRMSFEWLIRNVKEEDWVYIYFSGHGGHEDITISKLGYLHAYDSYDATYGNGGNIDLNYLENILRTFSQRGAKTFLFLDVCHAGKIGNDDYLYLNNSLATKVPNIIKILSAQGEEKSYEHSKWGGGHGVFTYYLLQGILGYADNAPKNSVVSLYELEKYLIDKVPSETEYNQIPIVIASNKRDVIFLTIDQTLIFDEGASESLANLKETTEIRFPLGDISSEDNEISSFRTFLNQYDLIKDDLNILFKEFESRSQNIIDKEKKDQVLDQLVAKVLNTTQNYINTFIGIYEGDAVRLSHSDAKYRISDALIKTLTIVDDSYSEYNLLLTRRIFFESEKVHDSYHQNKVSRLEINQTIDNLNYAIEKDWNASYLQYQVGVLSWHINELETAKKYLNKARLHSPNWSFPDIVLGILFSKSAPDSSIYYYRQALPKEPKVTSLYTNMANYFIDEAENSSNVVNTRINYDSAVFYLNITSNLVDSAFRSKNYEIVANIYEAEFEKFNDELFLLKAITYYRKTLLNGAENFQGISAALGYNHSILNPNSSETAFYEAVVISFENIESGILSFQTSFESGFSDKEIIAALPSFLSNYPGFTALIKKFKLD
jgi:Caspase domain